MTVPHKDERWLKASGSNQEGDCVELSNTGAVRDSKNPAGPVLTVDLGGLITAVKDERLDSMRD